MQPVPLSPSLPPGPCSPQACPPHRSPWSWGTAATPPWHWLCTCTRSGGRPSPSRGTPGSSTLYQHQSTKRDAASPGLPAAPALGGGQPHHLHRAAPAEQGGGQLPGGGAEPYKSSVSCLTLAAVTLLFPRRGTAEENSEPQPLGRPGPSRPGSWSRGLGGWTGASS